MKKFVIVAVAAFAVRAVAWDYEGHRMVNTVALASLPADFPAFVKTPEARERIAFLSGEPDRWRNTSDVTLRHFNGPDHFLDIDLLSDHGLSAEGLPIFRYDFTVDLAKGRGKTKTESDPSKDADHTRNLIGFLPWTIAEYQSKLRSGFSYLKTFQEFGGTSDEIDNAEQNIIYIMGVMGHFVGDASQPLHTTKHHNGWIGENPNNYSTNRTIHTWIDGGFIRSARITTMELTNNVPAAKFLAGGETNVFTLVMTWLNEQHKLVEPLYQLDRDGKLGGRRGNDLAEGRIFISRQLRVAGQMLGDLWLTAWKSAPVDTYLRGQLERRKDRNQP